MADHLKLILDWVEETLDATDPDDENSHFCDHARECAEGIAFDTRRDRLWDAIKALRTQSNGGGIV